ncbi:MAG: hypothetical protein AABZ62_07295 [Planctomycetota bacterium]
MSLVKTLSRIGSDGKLPLAMNIMKSAGLKAGDVVELRLDSPGTRVTISKRRARGPAPRMSSKGAMGVRSSLRLLQVP